MRIEGIGTAMETARQSLEAHQQSLADTAGEIARNGPTVDAVVRLRLDSIGVRADIAVLRAATEAEEAVLDLLA